MKLNEIDKPKTELVALNANSVMLNDGTACMVYKAEIGLYLYHINSNTWYKVTRMIKKEKIKQSNSKDSKNPF
jgi:hypothetical protein